MATGAVKTRSQQWPMLFRKLFLVIANTQRGGTRG